MARSRFAKRISRLILKPRRITTVDPLDSTEPVGLLEVKKCDFEKLGGIRGPGQIRNRSLRVLRALPTKGALSSRSLLLTY